MMDQENGWGVEGNIHNWGESGCCRRDNGELYPAAVSDFVVDLIALRISRRHENGNFFVVIFYGSAPLTFTASTHAHPVWVAVISSYQPGGHFFHIFSLGSFRAVLPVLFVSEFSQVLAIKVCLVVVLTVTWIQCVCAIQQAWETAESHCQPRLCNTQITADALSCLYLLVRQRWKTLLIRQNWTLISRSPVHNRTTFP